MEVRLLSRCVQDGTDLPMASATAETLDGGQEGTPWPGGEGPLFSMRSGAGNN